MCFACGCTGFDIAYVPISLPGIIPEYRTRSKPQASLGVAPKVKQNKTKQKNIRNGPDLDSSTHFKKEEKGSHCTFKEP